MTNARADTKKVGNIAHASLPTCKLIAPETILGDGSRSLIGQYVLSLFVKTTPAFSNASLGLIHTMAHSVGVKENDIQFLSENAFLDPCLATSPRPATREYRETLL